MAWEWPLSAMAIVMLAMRLEMDWRSLARALRRLVRAASCSEMLVRVMLWMASKLSGRMM